MPTKKKLVIVRHLQRGRTPRDTRRRLWLRQLGLTRYETAFQILHKLRSGMERREPPACVAEIVRPVLAGRAEPKARKRLSIAEQQAQARATDADEPWLRGTGGRR